MNLVHFYMIVGAIGLIGLVITLIYFHNHETK